MTVSQKIWRGKNESMCRLRCKRRKNLPNTEPQSICLAEKYFHFHLSDVWNTVLEAAIYGRSVLVDYSELWALGGMRRAYFMQVGISRRWSGASRQNLKVKFDAGLENWKEWSANNKRTIFYENYLVLLSLLMLQNKKWTRSENFRGQRWKESILKLSTKTWCSDPELSSLFMNIIFRKSTL